MSDRRAVPHEPSELARGAVSESVATGIAIALIVTPLLLQGIASVWWDVTRDAGSFESHCYPLLSVVGVMFLCLVRTRRVSRWVRAAVLVPFIQLGTMLLGWYLWRAYDPGDWHEYVDEQMPLLYEVSEATVIAIAAGMVVVAGVVWAFVRPASDPRWLRSLSVFFLAHMLFLGIWVPLLGAFWSESFLDYHRRFALVALFVPTALAVTGVGLLWLNAWSALKDGAAAVLVLSLFVAISLRLVADDAQLMTYSNFVHILCTEAIIALVFIYTLAFVHWRSLRATRRLAHRGGPTVQRGIVDAPSGEVVGLVELPGWLKGLRTTTRQFQLRTVDFVLDVPAGSRLVVSIPPETARMAPGSSIPVLRGGDWITVSGYETPEDAGPYRTSHLPLPGSRGLVITVAPPEGATAWDDVLLTLWRPCFLYLLVATAIALPGIAAL